MRVLRLAAAAAVVPLVCAVAVSSASAQVADPIAAANWTTAPAGGSSITALLNGTATFALPIPLQPTWTDVLRGARIWPELELDPPFEVITLGLGAFTAGYLIGTAIHHAWAHFDGSDLGTTYAVGSNTPPVRLDVCTNTSTPCFGFLPSGPIWAYEWGSSWGTLYYDSTDAVRHAAYVVLHGLTAGTEVCVAQTTAPGGGSECMYQRYLTKDQLQSALRLDQPLQTYTGQPHAISGGWRQPGGCGDTTTACPYNVGSTDPIPCFLVSGVLHCGGTPTDPFWIPNLPTDPTYTNSNTNEFRCLIDPQNWGCPGVDSDNEWDDTGGPKITMPDCHGLSVAACEAIVNAALAATGSAATAAFSTVTAPTYDATLPDGYVLATLAAANTLSDASSVTLELNESTAPKPCSSETAYPHKSTTMMSRGMMLVKGRVTCPSSQTVSINVVMWKCSSMPQRDRAALDAGSWGCSAIADEPWTFDVIGGIPSAEFPAASVEAPQSGMFYIGSTSGPDVLESWSQVTTGDQWLP